MKFSLLILALFAVMIVANGNQVRVDIQPDDTDGQHGRIEIQFTYNWGSCNREDRFSIPNQNDYV